MRIVNLDRIYLRFLKNIMIRVNSKKKSLGCFSVSVSVTSLDAIVVVRRQQML